MHDIASLAHEIEALKARNRRVELEKKRETSAARRISIALITYILLGAYMYLLGQQRRYLDAIIPTVGFVLGGMGMKWAKVLWMKRHK